MLWYSNNFGITIQNKASWIHTEWIIGLDEKLYITKPNHIEGEYYKGETSLLHNSNMIIMVRSNEEQCFLEGLLLDNIGEVYKKALTRKSRQFDKFNIGKYKLNVEYYNEERYDNSVTIDNAISRKKVTCTIPPRVLEKQAIWTYR